MENQAQDTGSVNVKSKESSTILFATGNQHKLQEIRQILEGTGLSVISMKEAGVNIDIEETGSTFAENAWIKANAVCQATGRMAMADDSGLVIDCLDGAPGVYSARYLGEDTSYDIKNAEILRRLQDVPDAQRSARFVCAMCCVMPDGIILRTEETMEGRIAHRIAGENGFGYDPILYLPEYGCTSAQLTPEEKNAISHRGKALRAMKERLKNHLTKS